MLKRIWRDATFTGYLLAGVFHELWGAVVRSICRRIAAKHGFSMRKSAAA